MPQTLRTDIFDKFSKRRDKEAVPTLSLKLFFRNVYITQFFCVIKIMLVVIILRK